MIFNVDDRELYINLKDATSISTIEGVEYDGDIKKKMFYIEVAANNFMNRVFADKSEDLTKRMFRKILEETKNFDPEKTYLEGFKDGTEYALKLMKNSK